MCNRTFSLKSTHHQQRTQTFYAPVEEVDVLGGHVVGDLIDELVDALLLRAVRLGRGVHRAAPGVLAQAPVLVFRQVVLSEVKMI